MSRYSQGFVFTFAWAVTSLAASALAQDDPLAKSVGISRSIGSLPAWQQPSQQARQDLGDFIRQAQNAVLLVGHPRHGRGTAWVVSKEHRLLATNAHVADILHEAGGSMMAIVNGTATVFKVERAWYHPGVRRQVAGPTTVLKSSNPADGPVDPNCPDLAILQLSSEGGELPAELKMAAPDRVTEIFALPAAILGFPGHDTRDWPQIGETAAATYHDGVISRLTDFRNNVSVPAAERQFVQYTMSTWGGFSGSPVFLPSGEVVAIHNSANYLQGAGGDVKAIPHGVRIDCLWELIAHHGLEDKIPLPVEKSSLDIDRWLRDDPADENVRKAMALVREAGNLIYQQEKFAEGVAKCKEAADLTPGYAEIYNVRCDGYLNYWFKHRRQISSEAALQQLEYAERDAQKYLGLNPTDPWAYINIALVYNNGGQHLDHDPLNQKAYDIISKLLESDNMTNNQRAAALSNRAIALDNLDLDDDALRDHNEAVRIDPKNAQWYENRADFWRYQGRGDLEAQDYATARRIRQGN
jgi:tetratricopeptide (TPR) repeat protein